MTSLRTASGIAAALLVASLGVKAIALARPEPADDTAALLAAVAATLRQDGFDAVRVYEQTYVTAARGACRVRVRPFSPHGTERLLVEHRGAAFGSTRYGYGGAWHVAPPKLRPLLAFYLQREAARVGVGVPRQAIVAVSARCPPPPGLASLPVRQG